MKIKAKSLPMMVVVLLLSGCVSYSTSSNNHTGTIQKQNDVCERWRRLSDMCYNYNNNKNLNSMIKESNMARCMEARAGKQAGYENVPVRKPSYCY